MTFFATFVVLAVIGIADAGYLVYARNRRKAQPLICPLGHDCSVVTESRWSHILGVRNETLGLVFYIAALAGIVIALTMPGVAPSIIRAVLWTSVSAFIFSMFLVYVQFFVIHDYCFYCLLSAVINLMLVINAAALI